MVWQYEDDDVDVDDNNGGTIMVDDNNGGTIIIDDNNGGEVSIIVWQYQSKTNLGLQATSVH